MTSNPLLNFKAPHSRTLAWTWSLKAAGYIEGGLWGSGKGSQDLGFRGLARRLFFEQFGLDGLGLRFSYPDLGNRLLEYWWQVRCSQLLYTQRP